MGYVMLYWSCVLLAAWRCGEAAPAEGGRVVFPDEPRRQEKRLEEVITPPVLPVIAHLEHDPSTLLPNEKPQLRSSKPSGNEVKPRFGLSSGFDVSPNSDGGLTASFSHGYSGLGGHSQAAAHSFSVGFNNGFQASQSASHAGSFSNNGFHSSFSGSQASSQASSFSAGGNGISASAAAASASAASNGLGSAHGQSAGFGTSYGGSAAGSQSASSSFGNSLANAIGSAIAGNNGPTSNYGDGSLDIRHRGGDGRVATSIVFPGETERGRFRGPPQRSELNFGDNRWRGSSTSYRSNQRSNDGSDWLAILVSD